MSAEPLNMSPEKRRAFRAGKFPEDKVTKDMIREVTCTTDCAPGTPNYKEFRVTEGMLFTRVPQEMSPPLEYCDMLLKINGISITSKKQMQEVIYKLAKAKKAHYLVFTVRRIISCERIEPRNAPANASIRKPDSKDLTLKPNYGYNYYKIVLIYFPKAKLGINVKSYANVVYVSATENVWGSTTRRLLFLGDAILKIDDTEILDVQTCANMLRSNLQKNGIVTLYIERTIGQSAGNFVRGVLTFDKKELDPHVPEDVVQLCKAQLDRYEKLGFREPLPIYRGYTKDYSTAGRVSISKVVENKKITSEPLNMAHLKPYTHEE